MQAFSHQHQVIDTFTGLKGSSPLLYRDIEDFGTPDIVIRVRASWRRAEHNQAYD